MHLNVMDMVTTNAEFASVTALISGAIANVMLKAPNKTSPAPAADPTTRRPSTAAAEGPAPVGSASVTSVQTLKR